MMNTCNLIARLIVYIKYSSCFFGIELLLKCVQLSIGLLRVLMYNGTKACTSTHNPSFDKLMLTVCC